MLRRLLHMHISISFIHNNKKQYIYIHIIHMVGKKTLVLHLDYILNATQDILQKISVLFHFLYFGTMLGCRDFCLGDLKVHCIAEACSCSSTSSVFATTTLAFFAIVSIEISPFAASWHLTFVATPFLLVTVLALFFLAASFIALTMISAQYDFNLISGRKSKKTVRFRLDLNGGENMLLYIAMRLEY